MMRLPKFEHFQPESLAEALELLAEHREHAKVVAGGTELLVSMKHGLLTPSYLINLKEVPELSFIAYDDEKGLRMGALTRLTTLIKSQAVQQNLPILAQAADQVAAPPLQQMGTLGGNLCLNTRCFYYNQSRFWRQARPACYKTGGEVCHVVKGGNRCFAVYQGDMAPALIALEATVKVARKGGERVIPLADIYTGKGKRPLALEADEILVEVEVPQSAAFRTGNYQKLRYRGAMDFPLVGVAAVLGKNGSGACSKANIVLTAVGTAPVLVEEAGKLLEGQSVTDELISQAAEAAYQAAHPVANVGSTPSYRKKMARLLTKRAIRNAWEGE
jgi:4-hydroxybenzoyl-CoA reductase subunit beta